MSLAFSIWCLAVWMTGLGWAADTRQEVWGKVLNAYGGREALEQLKRWCVVRLKSGDQEGISSRWHDKRNGGELLQTTVGKLITREHEGIFAKYDFTGWRRELEPWERSYYVTETFVSTIPFGLVSSSLTLTALEPARGKGDITLSVSLFGGEEVQLFVDPATWLIRQAVIPRSDSRWVRSLRDYRSHQGLQVPWVIDAPPHERLTMTCLSISVNEAMVTDPVGATPYPIDAITWPDGVSRVKVPAEVLANGQAMFEIQFKGARRPLRCLLDSGCSSTVLSEQAVQGISLVRSYGGKTSPAAGEAMPVSLAMMPDVRVGDVTWRHRVWGVMPHMAGSFDGLLGYDVFRGVAIEISYATNEVWMMKADTYHPPGGAISLDFSLAEDVPLMTAMVDGKPAELMMDLGSAFPVVLCRSYVASRGWRERAGEVGTGMGGSERTGLVTLTKLEIGQSSWPRVKARVIQGFDYPNGFIGAPLFRHMKSIVFDYERKQLHLIPQE